MPIVPAITEQNRRWWVLVAMTVVMLPLTIDGFGFVVALPTIASDLRGGTTDLAWVLNVAILFFGASVMVMARLADIFGRRRLLLVGIVVLALASVGCALAPTIGALIVLGALEGLGMGIVYGASFPIVTSAFPPEQRSTGIGLWAAAFLTGNVFGGVLAGWLSQSVSWRALSGSISRCWRSRPS
jgi:MFS family permease